HALVNGSPAKRKRIPLPVIRRKFPFTFVSTAMMLTDFLFFFLMLPPPPRSTLFPYTTLFRSSPHRDRSGGRRPGSPRAARRLPRSEEHTSELQSRGHLVCRLLLEKKKMPHSCL